MSLSRKLLTRIFATAALATSFAGISPSLAAAATATTISVEATGKDSNRDGDLTSGSKQPAPTTVSTARAEPASRDEINVAASRGFEVFNLSGSSLRLRSVTGTNRFEGRTPDGAIAKPAETHRFEMQLVWVARNSALATYDIIRPDGSIDGQLVLLMTLDTGFFGETRNFAECKANTSKDGVVCSSDYRGFTILDKAGTERTIDGSGENAFAADVFQNLCNAGRATCSFAAKEEKKVFGPRKLVGSPTYAMSNATQGYDYGWDETESATDSVGGSVSLKIPIAPVELTIQATYSRTWTKTKTIKENVKMNIPAWHWGWVEQRAALLQHTGDFTVNFYNTIWHIKNVVITSPDPETSGANFVFTEPLTQEEIDEIMDGRSAPTFPTGLESTTQAVDDYIAR